MSSKICRICHTELPLDKFYKAATTSDGFRTECKTCNMAQSKAFKLERAKNRPVVETSVQTCPTCHTEKPMHDFYKNAATPNGYEYDCKLCHTIKHGKGTVCYEKRLARNRATRDDRRRECERRYHEANKEFRLRQSRKQYQKHKQKYMERSRRRQVLKQNARIGRVSFSNILKRDGYICHICNKTVEHNKVHFDHVIPLSRGGSHTEDNIKVAHSVCNLRKGSRLMSELTAYHRRG